MNGQTAIFQLGGLGKLKAMINARDFAKGEDFIQFKFSGNPKMNIAKIRLTPADEYEITFYKFAKYKCKELQTVPAWAGNLKRVFEAETGLYLSL